METSNQSPAAVSAASRPDYRAYGSVLLGATLWGITGLFTKPLLSAGLSPYSMVLVRNFGGMILLLAVFLWRDRSVFRVQAKHLKYFFGTGVVSGLFCNLCYFACLEISSLAVTSILMYTAPAIVVLLSALLWREPLTKRKLAALCMALLGCACVTGIFAGALTVTVQGIFLGLGAAFFYALYSIFSRCAMNAGYPSMTVTVWTFLFAGVFSLFLLRPEELITAFSLFATPWQALGLVVFSTVLANFFYTRGLSRIEAGRASIIGSLEPVVASLIGVLVFGEPLGLLTLAGIACVLAGVWILK